MRRTLGDDVPASVLPVLDAIDVLRDHDCTVERLSGGLTNMNYKIEAGAATYVLRISPPGAELLDIDRVNEHHNSVRADRVGVGAPVVAWEPAHNALLVGFIEGRTFDDSTFSEPGMIPRVAHAVRRLHSSERFMHDFDMFRLQRRYLGIVTERGFRLPERYLDFLPLAERIRGACAVQPSPTVPCNNDLLAANFIDDGADIRIIDYEYSGNNDPCFELGNIWSECHLSAEGLEELLETYYGAHLRNRIARARLLGLMSQYGWTLWGSIQASTSTLDFDFWGWAMEKYERALVTFGSSELDRLIDDVQRED